MIVYIGVIIGTYTTIRLLELFTSKYKESSVFILVIEVLGIIVIVFLTLAIILSSTEISTKIN